MLKFKEGVTLQQIEDLINDVLTEVSRIHSRQPRLTKQQLITKANAKVNDRMKKFFSESLEEVRAE